MVGRPWSRPAAGQRLGCGGALLVVLFVLSVCASPVPVTRIDPQRMQRTLDASALTRDRLSEESRNVLRRHAPLELFDRDAGAAIAALNARLSPAGHADRQDLFALN